MITEGIYFDMPEAEYHADPCPRPSLSASLGKIIIDQTPLHAFNAHPRLNPKHEAEDSDRFDLGKAIHSLMTHDDRQFVIVDAADWRKDCNKALKQEAYDAGKTPLLKKQYDRLLKMAQAARQQISVTDAPNAFVGGKSEVTLIWLEFLGGDSSDETNYLWCRCRIDHCAENGIDFYDFKSTEASVNPDDYSRLFFNMGYDFTEAFYRRGIRRVLGVQNPSYRFIAQENYEPFALSVMGVDLMAQEIADQNVERAIQKFGQCLKQNLWPGYPTRTSYLAAPAYHEKKALDRIARAEFEEADAKAATHKHVPVDPQVLNH